MQADTVNLCHYWRSSASYRLRIALNIADINYVEVPVNLLTEENLKPEYLARNPQGLVPVLEIDGKIMTQSLAIIEYLNETRGDVRFLPGDPIDRQSVRALSCAAAMEIHPVCNLRVVACAAEYAHDESFEKKWMQKFIPEGLFAFEAMLEKTGTDKFCFGDTLTLADICLVPQVYNALRWEVDLSSVPDLFRIYENCSKLPAFIKAHPDNFKPQ